MGTSKTKLIVGMIAVVAFVATALFLLTRGPESGAGLVQRLPDGSTLELRTTAFTTNYTYRYQGGNRLQRFIAPILPDALKKWLVPQQTGSVGWDNGDTNLFVITVNRNPAANWSSQLSRLVVFDEQTNLYDAALGASTLGNPNEYVHGWWIRAFPRRSKTLGLRFIGENANHWTTAAQFKIPNPAFAVYPQWTPESRPITKTDDDLSVTLNEFQAGMPMQHDETRADENSVARKTRIRCSFSQRGLAVDSNWRVQKLVISDATGNRWFPWLDFVKQDFDWVTNGTVEFFGALWPGENAWKLEVECVRIAGFSADELWETPPIQLPALGQLTDLTNNWQHDGVTVQLVALSSPNTDHPGQFKWIAKWWGEDKSKVYSLALKISPELKGHRLTVVRAVDQDGREVEIVQHGSQDNAEQAVFLKPPPESRQLKLTFALQRSRFVQFLARPDFVKTGPTNSPTKN